jgi:hypothetical protein
VSFARIPDYDLEFQCRDSFYTTLCNAMDYTTSVFTVTHVDSKVDLPAEPHEFYNHEDEAIYKLCESEFVEMALMLRYQ